MLILQPSKITHMQEQAHKTGFRGDLAFPPVATAYLYSSRFGKADGNVRHQHNTLEVCLVTGGTIDWRIGEDGVVSLPGQVVIVGPHIPHGSFDSVLYPCEYIALQLHLDQLGLEAGALARLSGTKAAFCGSGFLELAVREVFNEHKNRGPFAKEVVKKWCDLICLHAIRSQPLPGCPGPVSELVSKAQGLLLGSQSGCMTASDAARQLGVSTAWLVSKFKEEAGLPPAEWLRGARAKEAAKLLAETDLPVAQIAAQLGLPTSQFFSASFKKETGLTPSDYRRKAAGRTSPDGKDEVIEAYY